VKRQTMKSKNKEIKRLEKELKMAQEKYEKNNDEKLILANLLANINTELEESLYNEKRFIASVSHELRTPMTSILGYGELLADTPLSSRQKRYLESITQSSHYLLSLINDLLDVAKFADKRIELNPKITDLYEIVVESTNLIRSKIAQGVEFHVHVPTLEYKIKVDDKRLKQILINLLSNAAKFTKEGSVECSVESVQDYNYNQVEIVIDVKDTGIGISPQYAEKLFLPFSSTDTTQGTGLGLFISQELAHLMHGEITYKPLEGGGTIFSMRILVEKSIQKEIGKGLIEKDILMCSREDAFVDSIAMELQSIGMEKFEHYIINEEDISSILIDVLPHAKKYDMLILDVDICKENTPHIAKMFKLIHPDIQLFAWMNDDVLVDMSIFDMVLSKPLAYQQFILELENFSLDNGDTNLYIPNYAGLKILLVDDVEMNRIYEAEMFHNFFNIICDVASNGLIALEMAKENHYDAIFMDMRMPVMNGQESTQKIREFDKVTPIICMSANVYKEDKLEAQEAGMNAFIEKPLEKSDIEQQLLKLINHKSIYQNEFLSSQLIELSLTHLRENFDEHTVLNLFDMGMASIEDSIGRIMQHVPSTPNETLIDNFHALKGILLNLGLLELAEQANSLQVSVKEGKIKDKSILIKSLLSTLNQLLENR